MNEEILTGETTERADPEGERIITCFDCFKDFEADWICPHCGYEMPF